MNGWTSRVNCHPVKSEMPVAAPTSQAKEPIQLDTILVCRKQTADIRKMTAAPIAFHRAVERATSKASRFKSRGFTLSVNDRRVILISQFLVETCAGRSAEQIADVLSSSLTDLDLAAMRLLGSDGSQPVQRATHDDKQFALFDKPETKRVSQAGKHIVSGLGLGQDSD